MNQLHSLWPTPLLQRHFPEHQSVNAELIKLFYAQRAQAGGEGRNVYSSPDDLLERYPTPAMQALFGFISDSVFQVASTLNGPIWQQMQPGKLQMHVVGAWFQIQNRFGFHDIHNHGNCSWSGVYYLQIDPQEKRESHPVLGKQNGLTRFYAQHLSLLGGAHMDLGNAYMQQATFDIAPQAGGLMVFPSWLLHKAMPYDGDQDRIIVSFNAQVHGERGNQAFDYDFT